MLEGGGNQPSKLQQVRLAVVKNDVCDELFGEVTIRDSHICAGDATTGGCHVSNCDNIINMFVINFCLHS